MTKPKKKLIVRTMKRNEVRDNLRAVLDHRVFENCVVEIAPPENRDRREQKKYIVSAEVFKQLVERGSS